MTRWLGYTSVATLIAFALSLVPTLALAAPPAPGSKDDINLMQAQLHYESGRKAYEQGDYETAIRQWSEAQRIKPSPKLDYNIGLAYEKLGRPREALAYYTRFLQQSPNASNRAEVEAKLPELQAQAEQGQPPPGYQGQPPSGYQGQPPPAGYQGQPPPPGYQGQPPPPGYQGQPPPPGYQGQPPPPGYQGQPPPPGYQYQGQAPPPVGPYFPPPVRKKKRRLWWVVFPVIGGVGLIVGVALLARALTSDIYYTSALTHLPLEPTPAPANDGALFRF